MNETVRDAVFGNVGTMISFRVSADDAPILAKQFEPNFEAVDLLQMHNRNFVINMVIGGEKTPAFSARTLELPPSQADNTLHIIEHSRRMYSRSSLLLLLTLVQPNHNQLQTIMKSFSKSAAIIQTLTLHPTQLPHQKSGGEGGRRVLPKELAAYRQGLSARTAAATTSASSSYTGNSGS